MCIVLVLAISASSCRCRQRVHVAFSLVRSRCGLVGAGRLRVGRGQNLRGVPAAGQAGGAGGRRWLRRDRKAWASGQKWIKNLRVLEAQEAQCISWNATGLSIEVEQGPWDEIRLTWILLESVFLMVHPVPA